MFFLSEMVSPESSSIESCDACITFIIAIQVKLAIYTVVISPSIALTLPLSGQQYMFLENVSARRKFSPPDASSQTYSTYSFSSIFITTASRRLGSRRPPKRVNFQLSLHKLSCWFIYKINEIITSVTKNGYTVHLTTTTKILVCTH